MEHLRKKFLRECAANLELVSRSLRDLDMKPPREGALNELFRGVHSIKGGAGFFDLDRLGWLAGEMEDLCGRLIAGSLAMSADVTMELARAAQVLADLVEAAEAGIDLVAGYEQAAGNALRGLYQPA